MKKVMVMFAAIAMAIAASASTFAWGISGGGAIDADTFGGGTAYLFYGTGTLALPTIDTNVESFNLAAVTGDGWTMHTSGTVAADGTFYDTSLGNMTSIGGKTGTIKFYMAVISDDGMSVALVDAVKSAQIRNTTTAASAGWTASAFTTITAQGGGDVPEPTSGLLLLVGGAMLALRRRRA